MSEPLAIRPFLRPARGVARVPGSKSVTNRALILAALADGETLLTGALFSRDTRILVTALRELGFDTAADERARTIRVRGLGGKIPARSARLHVGNAGTAARFLTAFLALAPGGRYELDGDEAMRARYRAVWSMGLTGGLNYYRASPLRPARSPQDTLHTLEIPDALTTVRVPTTVLWGERDRALLPGLLDGLERWVPRLEIVRVPEASHWIVHEQPERVWQAITRALAAPA